MHFDILLPSHFSEETFVAQVKPLSSGVNSPVPISPIPTEGFGTNKGLPFAEILEALVKENSSVTSGNFSQSGIEANQSAPGEASPKNALPAQFAQNLPAQSAPFELIRGDFTESIFPTATPTYASRSSDFQKPTKLDQVIEPDSQVTSLERPQQPRELPNPEVPDGYPQSAKLSDFGSIPKLQLGRPAQTQVSPQSTANRETLALSAKLDGEFKTIETAAPSISAEYSGNGQTPSEQFPNEQPIKDLERVDFVTLPSAIEISPDEGVDSERFFTKSLESQDESFSHPQDHARLLSLGADGKVKQAASQAATMETLDTNSYRAPEDTQEPEAITDPQIHDPQILDPTQASDESETNLSLIVQPSLNILSSQNDNQPTSDQEPLIEPAPRPPIDEPDLSAKAQDADPEGTHPAEAQRDLVRPSNAPQKPAETTFRTPEPLRQPELPTLKSSPESESSLQQNASLESSDFELPVRQPSAAHQTSEVGQRIEDTQSKAQINDVSPEASTKLKPDGRVEVSKDSSPPTESLTRFPNQGVEQSFSTRTLDTSDSPTVVNDAQTISPTILETSRSSKINVESIDNSEQSDIEKLTESSITIDGNITDPATQFLPIKPAATTRAVVNSQHPVNFDAANETTVTSDLVSEAESATPRFHDSSSSTADDPSSDDSTSGQIFESETESLESTESSVDFRAVNDVDLIDSPNNSNDRQARTGSQIPDVATRHHDTVQLPQSGQGNQPAVDLGIHPTIAGYQLQETYAATAVQSDGIAINQTFDPESASSLRNQVSQTLFSELKAVTRSVESSEITMDLHPAELGKLTLTVSVDNESLSASIVTSELATNDLLMRDKQILVDAMREQGLELGSFEVSYDGNETQQHSNESSSFDQQPNSSSQSKITSEPSTDSTIQTEKLDGINLIA